MNKKEQETINRIMKGLHCTLEEAKEIYAYDMQVEHGEKTEFDLPADKKKVAQKYAHTGTRTTKKPMIPNLPKKSKPKDATKEQIIAEIADFLRNSASFQAENIEIVNSAKIITFKIGEQAYKIDLTATRKKKS